MILNSQFSWPQAFFYVVFMYAASVSSSPSQISYLDHCSSIVPESPYTLSRIPTLLLPGTENGYCSGGDRILGRDSSDNSRSFSKRLALLTRNVYRTEDEGVFRVKGSLNLESNNMYYSGEDLREEENFFSGVLPRSFWNGSVTFLLHGFWSESSGKLCMVGTSSAYSMEGALLDLSAVLKLNNVKNMSTITDLVNGSLESLNLASDLNYFEPISILVFPQLNYKYSLVSELGLGSKNVGFCSILARTDNWFELEYPHDCYSSQNCSPFGGEIGFYLPNLMNIRASQCTEDEQRMQVMIKFHNSSYVDNPQLPSPIIILVGEGWWDAKNNQILIVACRILNAMESSGNAWVGSCSIRLSLEFPAIWSIRSRRGFLGKIWRNETVDDSRYFSRITFRSPMNMEMEIPGLKYEYTEIDKAGKVCQKKEPAENNGGRIKTYPNPKNSFDMQFDMEVKNSNGVFGWGSAAPLFVGNNLYDPSEYGTLSSISETGSSVVSISYKISFKLEHGSEFGRHMKVDISAEGFYDAKTGCVCMVGCRRLNSRIRKPKNESLDCEILVHFQFPPLGSKDEVYIRGCIESTRERSDPLYFNSLDISSSSSTDSSTEAEESGCMAIIMLLISNTLTCFLTGLQLLHVKKNPAVLPSISLVMLVILNFSFILPLGMNFSALFLGSFTNQNLWLHKEIWFLNNLIMLAAFLFHFRLFELTLSARFSNGKLKDLWVKAEKNSLYLSSPLYIVGFLISLFLNCKQKNFSSSPLMPLDLRYSSGLVFDWFLLPQILLNLFTNSKEKALSDAFSIGTTSVRLLQHAYEFCCVSSFFGSFEGSWTNANPGEGSYSTAWNAMVSFGSLMFSVVLLQQQQQHQHKRLKGQKVYDDVGLCHSLTKEFVD